MNKQPLSLVGALGLGAGLMYLLDSQQGARRRAVVRDKAVHTLHSGGAALGNASRDLAHRSKGLAMQAGARLRPDHADDQVLHDRVRSKMGRCVSHPSAIEVSVQDGRVTLTGDVLASEVGHLLETAQGVRGVREVENRCRSTTSPRMPHPCKEGRSGPGWVMQRNLPPATRLLLGAAGGALCVTALQRRRSLLDVALGTAGVGLIARSATNLELRQLTGIGAGRHAVSPPQDDQRANDHGKLVQDDHRKVDHLWVGAPPGESRMRS